MYLLIPHAFLIRVYIRALKYIVYTPMFFVPIHWLCSKVFQLCTSLYNYFFLYRISRFYILNQVLFITEEHHNREIMYMYHIIRFCVLLLVLFIQWNLSIMITCMCKCFIVGHFLVTGSYQEAVMYESQALSVLLREYLKNYISY